MVSQVAKRQKTTEMSENTLPVCIMEHHDTAVRWMHIAMRRKWMPFEKVSMLHFDAHPDMSWPPTLPAKLVFTPSELYPALRTDSGGIASWILPLVLGGHFDHLHFVRGEKSYQIADGSYDLEVGTIDEHDPETAPIRTSCSAPYFVEDGLYLPSAELSEQPRHTSKLVVSRLSEIVDDEKVNLEDTKDLLDTYVDAVETDLDKDHIKLKLRELYTEAQNLEVV